MARMWKFPSMSKPSLAKAAWQYTLHLMAFLTMAAWCVWAPLAIFSVCAKIFGHGYKSSQAIVCVSLYMNAVNKA